MSEFTYKQVTDEVVALGYPESAQDSEVSEQEVTEYVAHNLDSWYKRAILAELHTDSIGELSAAALSAFAALAKVLPHASIKTEGNRLLVIRPTTITEQRAQARSLIKQNLNNVRRERARASLEAKAARDEGADAGGFEAHDA